MFKNIDNLEEEIIKNIFPGLVVVEIPGSRVEMGFFLLEKWLVSNAHVIQNKEEIDRGILLRNYKRSKNQLDINKSYHRPFLNQQSPDIALIHTTDTYVNIQVNSLSSDETLNTKHYFYVDAEFIIHYLTLVSTNEDEAPQRYRS